MGNEMLICKPRFPVKQMVTIGALPTPLKVAYYRIRGAKIGPQVSIGLGSVIVAEEIIVGEGVSIGFGTYLRARRVEIGRFTRIGSASFFDAETIKIGEDARISEQVFVGGLSSPESHFHLGSRTILMQHTFINVARPVTIGDGTGIGGRCTIFTHGSWQDQLEGYPVTFAPVTIGSNVWIPWQVFIMPGVTIGHGATIGAGSLILKDIPAGSLALGSPAKVVRTSEQYPVRPDHSQQVNMLRQMILEFCDYVSHEGLKVNRDQQPEADVVTVVNKRGASHRLVVLYDVITDKSTLSTATVILSLVGLPENERRALESKQQMWLDIGYKQRGGLSNPLGEEIADFVKRYGIRFERTNPVA